MILEYHRPQTIEQALMLLDRQEPPTVPLGGGTVLSRTAEKLAVVDLQALHIDTIKIAGNSLEIGAAVTLQALVDFDGCQSDLRRAAYLEANRHIRCMATIAGALVSARGNSSLAAALLALDAKLIWLPAENETALGDFLPLRDSQWPGKLLAKVIIPTNVRLGYDFVARTPRDIPQVCAAVAQWPSGRTRVVVGGPGKAPILAMDGLEQDGAEVAAKNAYSHYSDGESIDPEFLKETAQTLVHRLITALGA